MSIEERFNTAVNVIKGLPKNGKNQLSINIIYLRRCNRALIIQVKNAT